MEKSAALSTPNVVPLFFHRYGAGHVWSQYSEHSRGLFPPSRTILLCIYEHACTIEGRPVVVPRPILAGCPHPRDQNDPNMPQIANTSTPISLRHLTRQYYSIL